MFENFGIMDVFAGIKKNKIKLLCAGIVGMIILSSAAKLIPVKADPLPVLIGNGVNALEIRAINVYFDYTGEEGRMTMAEMNKVYEATLRTTECRKYVYENITKKYSPEDIIKIMGIDMGVEGVTPAFISNYVSSYVDSAGLTVSITAKTPDARFSLELLDIYISWFEHLIETQGKNIEVVKMSTNEEIWTNPGVGPTTLAKKKGIGNATLALSTFMFSVLAGVLVVLLRVLFVPTLNRRTDFEAVGFEVIAEIDAKKENTGFISELIRTKAEEEGWKRIAFSATDAAAVKIDKYAQCFKDALKGNGEAELFPDLEKNPEAVFELKKYDKTLLVERYGYTRYKTLDRYKSYLECGGVDMPIIIALK